MTYLYLIRHGETELNQSGVYYGSTDCGLSNKGVEQAHGLKKIYKDIDIVISSPLRRASETAEIISGLDKEDMVIYEGLQEIDFGDWECLHYTQISAQYGEEWQGWINDWKYKAPPKGESFMSMFNRVKDSLKHILNIYKGKRIMIVSHQGSLRIITSILLGMKEEGYWNFTFEHGRYSLLEIEDGHVIVKSINAKD